MAATGVPVPDVRAELRHSGLVSLAGRELPGLPGVLLGPLGTLLGATLPLGPSGRGASPAAAAATAPRVLTAAERRALTAVGRADAGSVVRVTGVAVACTQTQEGSGFVVAPRRVLTNAHVVAGERTVWVQPAGVGRGLRGRVVLFDPAADLAVIDVPGLHAAPLRLGRGPARRSAVVAAGFPENGGYTLSAGLVTGTVDAVGSPDQGQPAGSRPAYRLDARIEPGNSGGPLLAEDGSVVGVVFARSLDDPQVGYALTAAEAGADAAAGAGLTRAVDTGACSR